MASALRALGPKAQVTHLLPFDLTDGGPEQPQHRPHCRERQRSHPHLKFAHITLQTTSATRTWHPSVLLVGLRPWPPQLPAAKSVCLPVCSWVSGLAYWPLALF